MKPFNVYTRNWSDLAFVGTVQAEDSPAALKRFLATHGGNYGTIVVMPVLPWVSCALECA